jgi:two-component system LytT family sensor kinase
VTGASAAVLVVLVALLLGAGFLLGRRTARPLRPSDVGTPVEHATFETLHTASLAAPPLRAGLTEESARRSARRLRSLLGTDALCLTDRERVLVWDGAGHHHGKAVMGHIEALLEGGRGTAFDSGCGASCGARSPPPPASACSTWTRGCARCTGTGTGSSSRPGSARA